MLAHQTEDQKREQTLRAHCENAGWLCGEFAAKIGLNQTGTLLGVLHDSGKAKEEFQNYLRTRDQRLRGKINHSACGARLVTELLSKEGREIEQFTAELLAAAVCSHHGGLLDMLTLKGENGLLKRQYPDQDNHYEECIDNFSAECFPRETLERLFRESVIEVKNLLQRMSSEDRFERGMIEKFLFSCLVDADRYDTFCFEQNTTPELDQPPDWEKLSGLLEKHLQKPEFQKKSDINSLRWEISDACLAFAKRPCGVYQLFVPTGGGKTLSSLRYALAHCAEYHKEHIYYVIPYCSILEQNADELREALQDQEGMILEHHSNVQMDKSGDDEECCRHELLTQRWTSGIVMTTMVQFLETLFSGGTQRGRKLHQLANSVIIFDEIQSIPLNCIHLFNAAVNFLAGYCNTTVVLCTATQPRLDATEPVPVKLSDAPNMIPDYTAKFLQFRRTRVVDMTLEDMTAETVAEFAIKQAEDKKSVLVVLNTKGAVKEVYDCLKQMADGIRVFLLSTNLCVEHRSRIIKQLKALTKHEEKVICVSTQLIEAGVDLSFQCAIRSLAGLDSVAQTAGRCNRHREYEGQREVYLVSVPGEKLEHLPEIKAAQAISKRILGYLRKHPGALGGDPTSPEAMDQYYKHYYHEKKDIMGYPVPEYNTTEYKLLSDNKTGSGRYKMKYQSPPPLHFYQAFQTAGENFEVIHSPTQGVLVPYGAEGEKLIADILGTDDLKEQMKLLRQAQRYTVSLYQPQLQKLIGIDAVVYHEAMEIFILKEGYYDQETGVTEQVHLDFQEF